MHIARQAERGVILWLILLFLALIFLVVILAGIWRSLRKEGALAGEAASQARFAYMAQIESVAQTEKSIKALLEFLSSQENLIKSQQTRIKESVELIRSLKTEEERLRTVVATDRKVVSALLGAQEQLAASRRSWEFWLSVIIGLISGFGTSFGGSVAYQKAQEKWPRFVLWRRRRAKPAVQVPKP